MILLDATNKSITALSDATATTTEPTVIVSYTDHTTTTFTPGASDTALNGTTPVTIVSSPDSSTQRQVKYISITNVDTASHTVTVRYINNATTRVLISIILTVGDNLIYTSTKGWYVLDKNGSNRNNAKILTSSTFLSGYIQLANLTTALTLTSDSSYAVWLGVAPKASSSISLRFRVTTAAATITWAEIGVFKGNVNLGGNPSLTRLGSMDTSGIVNSTGLNSVTVSLDTPTTIGDDLWAVIGAQASTAMDIRAGLADSIQTGAFAILASTRPSTVTSPTDWTIAGDTIAVPLIVGYVN